jgi:DNA-binding transcriptional MerR regulator
MITSAELTKLYYSIGEVAEMLDVNASLIRFWEKEFKQLAPKKNKKGNRKFTPEDILVLQRIYQLVKIEGLTLEGAKKALRDKSNAVSKVTLTESDMDEIIGRLTTIKKKLLSLKQ